MAIIFIFAMCFDHKSNSTVCYTLDKKHMIQSRDDNFLTSIYGYMYLVYFALKRLFSMCNIFSNNQKCSSSQFDTLCVSAAKKAEHYR